MNSLPSKACVSSGLYLSPGIPLTARRVCVAPMLNRTDRHFRYLMRQITRTALLYTELVSAAAIIRGRQRCMLKYHPIEHPVAIQFGGNIPENLAECARIAADYGFDEVNLNVGCPSARVAFGAHLMAHPDLVARCVEAMTKAVAIPVTVKHRIGIDSHCGYRELQQFVTTVAQSGCQTFIVHARKALLNGLSPRRNRSLPPLDHTMVHRLKREKPELTIITNGGITSLSEGIAHIKFVDGVMIGRAAYEAPYLLANVDQLISCKKEYDFSRKKIIVRMCEYLSHETAAGTPPAHVLRHMHGLFHGQPGASLWKKNLSKAINIASSTKEICTFLQQAMC